jgi:hypothetical protein
MIYDLNKLFMGTRDQQKSSYDNPITLSSGSHHYGSPRSYTLRHSDKSAQLTQMRHLLSKYTMAQEY